MVGIYSKEEQSSDSLQVSCQLQFCSLVWQEKKQFRIGTMTILFPFFQEIKLSIELDYATNDIMQNTPFNQF